MKSIDGFPAFHYGNWRASPCCLLSVSCYPFALQFLWWKMLWSHLYPACVHFPWPSVRLSAPMAVMRMAQISKHRLCCWYLCRKWLLILFSLCYESFSHLPFSYLHSLYVKCVVPSSMYRPTMAYHLMLDTFTMYSVLSDSGMIINSYIVYRVGYNLDSVHMASLAIEFMGFCKTSHLTKWLFWA